MFWREERKAPNEPGDPLLWHVDFIVALARLMQPAVHVELGVHRAELFNQVIPYAGELIGVDIDPRSADFVQTVRNARFVLGTTESFANDLRDSPIMIDMLFIDADHCRESVVRDFRDFLPFVRPHGLILVHDTHPGDASLLDPEWCSDAYLSRDRRTAARRPRLRDDDHPGFAGAYALPKTDKPTLLGRRGRRDAA